MVHITWTLIGPPTTPETVDTASAGSQEKERVDPRDHVLLIYEIYLAASTKSLA
jgi:hypothetical protein